MQPAMILTLSTKLIEPRMITLPFNVYHLHGKDGKPYIKYSLFSVEIESSATVEQLKVKNDEIEGVPPSRQNLVAQVNMVPNLLMLPMLDTDRLEDVVPRDKGICLVLTKGERSRNNLPVKVVVLSIPGP